MEKQRQTQRGRRRRAGVYNVSIVGYTNAGKSTLFNRLARADTLVADQLFATLDTTTRKLYVDPGIHVTLSDTVGFIRDLPHSLVAAFEATLTEAREADLLLHVVDAANPLRETQIDDVNAVLADIGASAIPQVIVNNKIDRLEAHPVATALRDADGKIRELRVAALQRVGMDLIREAIREQAQVGGYPLNGHHHTEPHGESALQSHQDSPASA
jgi:GTP-binding protein HflX